MQRNNSLVKSLDKRPKLVVPLLLLAVCLGASAAGHVFGLDCQPYGTIDYRGNPVPKDLRLEAFIDQQSVASGKTGDGDYSISIPSDDPDTPEKDGWAEGDTIVIKVDGFTAVPSIEAFPGTEECKLHVPTLNVNTTTWGKIKALFK
jgi:hypothetical protein